MKKTEAKRVDQIFREAIEATGNLETFERQRLCYVWAEVTGPWINSHTTRRYIEGRTLHVFITSASLKSELLFSQSSLVQALNRAAGADVIDNIVLH